MSKISLTLMDVCTRERNGEQVEKSVIKNVLRMLAALNVGRIYVRKVSEMCSC
jgi:hypothetical protein